MVLDTDDDDDLGFSALDYFERFCTEKNISRSTLESMALDDFASVINKLPGNVLELAACLEAADHAVDIAYGRSSTSAVLPSKVSARSVVSAVAWLGVSLCQRFMLQDEQLVLPVSH